MAAGEFPGGSFFSYLCTHRGYLTAGSAAQPLTAFPFVRVPSNSGKNARLGLISDRPLWERRDKKQRSFVTRLRPTASISDSAGTRTQAL